MEQKPNEEKLLSEFYLTTDQEWLAAAENLLKGKPFDKILRTRTCEGITLEPQYRREVWERLSQADELPGAGSYLRSSKTEGYHKNGWKIAQEIDCPSVEEFNKALLSGLKRGQNAVNFVIDKAGLNGVDPDEASDGAVGKKGTSLSILADLEIALKEVHLESVDINIQAYNQALEYAMLLVAYCEKKQIDITKLRGCIGADPLGHLAETGILPGGLDTAYNKMAGLTLWAKENNVLLKTISIHTQAYRNSGCSAVEELAFALSSGVEYIRQLSKFDLDVDDIAPRIQFDFILGENLFMEIAKFRAARQLWAMIIRSFGGNDESAKMYIHGRTGKYNKTKYDPYVNMLRTTIEAFAGIIGGVDSMHLGCFDEVIRTSDEFSRRIARNQQIILAEESRLGHVIDPAGGSWYIEDLTHKLVERVWSTFQEMEAEGCMSKLLISGKVHDLVKKVADFRETRLALRKDVLVGINMYANSLEQKLADNSLDYSDLKSSRITKINTLRQNKIEIEPCAYSIKDAWLNGATLGMITSKLHQDNELKIEPLPQHRLSEPYENLRDNMINYTAKNGKPVNVFLANIGTIKQYKPRADFSRGFFETGGFCIIDQGGYELPSEAAKEALKSKAKIVVICSTDSTYPEIVPKICKVIKEADNDIMLVLAGYPEDQIETHKEAGIDEFIHIMANAPKILAVAQKRTGVIL